MTDTTSLAPKRRPGPIRMPESGHCSWCGKHLPVGARAYGVPIYAFRPVAGESPWLDTPDYYCARRCAVEEGAVLCPRPPGKRPTGKTDKENRHV